MPITISAAQREALYVQVLDHLSGLGDLWLAIEGEDYPRADALGHAFADDLRLLLDDLGWPDRKELPPGGRVELTMPPEDLRRVIERLRDEATELFADTILVPADEKGVLRRTALAADACGRVLLALDREAGES
jgi:hypothetical protein